MPRVLVDLVGQRFGKLTVYKRAASYSGKSSWWCKCECGNICIVAAHNLQSGATTSCKCVKIDVSRKHAEAHWERYRKYQWGKPGFNSGPSPPKFRK